MTGPKQQPLPPDVEGREDATEVLRAFVLDSVSKTGGHLSSNLGTVELTIALHYVFDTPEDRVIWDVGHQTYPHKILTGRREAMSRLRMLGGISCVGIVFSDVNRALHAYARLYWRLHFGAYVLEHLAELREVLDAGADLVLLDNFTTDQMREAVIINDGRAVLEASGGLTIADARAVGQTGVDFMAVGALTHSARVMDIGADLRSI